MQKILRQTNNNDIKPGDSEREIPMEKCDLKLLPEKVDLLV